MQAIRIEESLDMVDIAIEIEFKRKNSKEGYIVFEGVTSCKYFADGVLEREDTHTRTQRIILNPSQKMYNLT